MVPVIVASIVVLTVVGAILNRTYGINKNLYIYLFLLTMFGSIYYGPP